ncbi:Tigger transposable element-derived protein 6-like [Oopsacas minuta]|uniref:Tigger transposable element-derived protein 6-like n=1 Tax=Oopsacas minuta TaxID=111878 RepID=A0AAV7JL15_9METZ|nr:Tigger transposable element-derived protein 6-like [Oopsacas minuta]
MSSTKSRKNLTFSQKLEILKEELGTLAKNNPHHTDKRVKSENEDLDEKLWEWFVATRSKKIPVSGPILQEKALDIATELEKTDFKAANDWLEKFHLRYNVNFQVLSGERAGIDQAVVKNWKQRLDSLINEYSPDDIFNFDETGLFYKALPTNSLVQKRDSSHGNKVPKERFTIFLCFNMSVTEKFIPLIIGKIKKPDASTTSSLSQCCL